MDEEIQIYDINDETQKRLDNDFQHHAPNESQIKRYPVLRAHAKSLAELACELVPESRERSLALTKLEEFVMWANAGIARNE